MSDFKVIDWNALPSFEASFFKTGSAISIGGFDGLHLGHMALLEAWTHFYMEIKEREAYTARF